MKTLRNGNNNFSLNKKSIELLKNTGIIGIGRISTYIISFLLLPIYTSYLSPESYGIVELVNNYVGLLSIIVTLQIEQGCFRYLIDSNKEQVLLQQIISTSILGLFAQILSVSFLEIVAMLIFNIDYMFFIVLNTASYSLLVLLQQISRGYGKNKYFAISGLITTLVAMILSCVNVIILKWDARGVLLATFISYIIAIIYLYIKNKVLIRVSEFKLKTYRELLRYSIPLIVNSVSWWIFNVSDRTIINYMMGLSYTGIYSIANKFSGIGMTLYGVFNTAWTETVSRYVSNENSQRNFLLSSMTKVYGIFSSFVFIMIATMPLVFPIFVNEKYYSAYSQTPILLLSVLAYGISAMYGALYIALKNTRQVAWTSFLSAIINIFINVSCIKKFGLFAASMSTFVAYLLLAIYRGYDINKKLGVYINKGVLLISFAVALLIVCLSYSNNYYSVVMNILIVCIYSVIINKSIIKNMLKLKSII